MVVWCVCSSNTYRMFFFKSKLTLICSHLCFRLIICQQLGDRDEACEFKPFNLLYLMPDNTGPHVLVLTLLWFYNERYVKHWALVCQCFQLHEGGLLRTRVAKCVVQNLVAQLKWNYSFSCFQYNYCTVTGLWRYCLEKKNMTWRATWNMGTFINLHCITSLDVYLFSFLLDKLAVLPITIVFYWQYQQYQQYCICYHAGQQLTHIICLHKSACIYHGIHVAYIENEMPLTERNGEQQSRDRNGWAEHSC